jgi:hypothetical protein
MGGLELIAGRALASMLLRRPGKYGSMRPAEGSNLAAPYKIGKSKSGIQMAMPMAPAGCAKSALYRIQEILRKISIQFAPMRLHTKLLNETIASQALV